MPGAPWACLNYLIAAAAAIEHGIPSLPDSETPDGLLWLCTRSSQSQPERGTTSLEGRSSLVLGIHCQPAPTFPEWLK